jgi:hypothetical protein
VSEVSATAPRRTGPGPETGPLFGDGGHRWLRGREEDIFPRAVRPLGLRLLWIAVLLAACGLLVLAGAIGRIL